MFAFSYNLPTTLQSESATYGPLEENNNAAAIHCDASSSSGAYGMMSFCCGPDSTTGADQYSVPRPMSLSIDEKMLQALSLFNDFSGGGILAQVWVPIRRGDRYLLTTSEQPYLLDQMLAGYREVSRSFTFSAQVKPGFPLGLPGRVFVSKMPEWTSNVIYYRNTEYLRVKHAVDHDIRGCIALPVFDPLDNSCCAVLELVTVKEKTHFVAEVEKLCHALLAVNLRSASPPRLLPQCLSRNQKAALAEITDVVRTACRAHRLPLALTWIPCNYSEEAIDEIEKVRVRQGNSRSNGKCILCIESTACYVNDKEMDGFVHACAEHYMEEGQGVAGKALQSHHPFFCPDVRTYDITEYPLVQHARKYGLQAAVAVRLTSTLTGDDNYILELFIPVSVKGSSAQQLLLNNLFGTMQRICKSLRTVSGAEFGGRENLEVGFQKASLPEDHLMDKMPVDGMESEDASPETNGPRKQEEKKKKKKSASEKNVSLSILRQYFSGSLKDAAKSIGVCPTTLKRICRQHGISRWPSSKINKVNRSLRKIQTVLDSVQEAKGGLKFDPTTGGFVAAGSLAQDAELEEFPLDRHAQNLEKPSTYTIDCGEDSKSISASAGFCQKNCLDNASRPSCSFERDERRTESSDPHPSYFAAGDGKATKVENDLRVVDPNRRICSRALNSSNSPDSCLHCSTSALHNCDRKLSKVETICNSIASQITIKATYKDDVIRFKFEPSAGCFQIYEEIAKRLKLQHGAFYVKYLDDEEEWVMLVSDADLQECLNILNYAGKRRVKFLVRDVPFATGSSGSSNDYFLAGASQPMG